MITYGIEILEKEANHPQARQDERERKQSNRMWMRRHRANQRRWILRNLRNWILRIWIRKIKPNSPSFKN